jgi:hypothetical protein
MSRSWNSASAIPLTDAQGQQLSMVRLASKRLLFSFGLRPLLLSLCIAWTAAEPALGQLNLFGRRPESAAATNVPANVKRVGTRLTGFGIPFSIENPEEKFVEVQLFMSKNRGLTWQFYARQNLDAREIPFEATGDGEYWFCLKTLDRNRQLQPPGNAKVELIVVVDTLQPEVDFRVQTDAAGRVVCRWKADDQNIDPTTVQLAYRPLLSENDAENTWVDVPYKAVEVAKNGTFSDQYAFWGDASAREMVVRLKIADLGGNEVVLERQIVSPRMTLSRPLAGTANRSGLPANLASSNVQRPVLPPPDMPLPSTRPGSTSSTPPASAKPAPTGKSNPLDPNCPDGKCPPQKPTLLGNWNPWKKNEAPEPPPASLPAAAFPNPGNALPTQLASGPTFPPSQLPAAGLASSGLANSGQANSGQGSSGSAAPRYASNSQDLVPTHPTNQAGVNPAARQGGTQPGPIQSNLHSAASLQSGDLYGGASGSERPAQATNSTAPSASGSASGTLWPSRSLAADGHSTNQGTALPFNQSASPRMSIGLGSTVDLPQSVPSSTPAISSSTPATADQNPLPGASAANGTVWPGNSTGSQVPPEFAPAPLPQAALNAQVPAPLLPPGGAAATTPPRDAVTAESAPLNVLPASATVGRPEEAAGPSVLSPAAVAPLPIAPPLNSAAALNVQGVGSQRFKLNYENTFLDPALIKSVVLWMTTDGGQNWTSYGEDTDCESPFPVQVASEGVYGFRIVFETKDGVMGRAPARGDQPDMWIRVDTTPPEVQLISAPFGRGADAGALVINWKATDIDLGERPVSLAWSPTSEGPWTNIVNGHPNTGSYAWRAGNQAPDRVFLQLEVTDAAGNRTTSQTTRPIELNGLAPRGRILSVDPVR